MKKNNFDLILEDFREKAKDEGIDFIVVATRPIEDGFESVIGINSKHGYDPFVELLFLAADRGEEAVQQFITSFTCKLTEKLIETKQMRIMNMQSKKTRNLN